MTFRFRLQRLLELREQREQAKARELSVAREAASLARQSHDSLSALHRTARAQTLAAQQAQPRVGHLQQFGVVLDAMEQRIEQAAEMVTTTDGAVAAARAVLDDAARDRRVLDRLKERHAEVARVAEALKDRVAMDDIALTRFAHRVDAQRGVVATSPSPPASVGSSTRTNGRTP